MTGLPLTSETPSGYTGEMAKVLHDLTGTVYFVIKQLRPSHVAEKTTKKNCTLMMPVWFVKEHGDKFHGTVALRSRKCMEPLTVQLSIQSCNASKPPKSPPEIKFGRGWKAFAIRNELSIGDALVFELTEMSEFVVHIVRKTASAPSSHAPEKPSIDSKLSQKNYGKKDCGAPGKQSEPSQKNGNGSSVAGDCVSQRRLASERTEGESVDDLSHWIAKKRKVGYEQDDASASLSPTLNSSMAMNSHPLESHDDLQASMSSEASHASQSSLKQPSPGAEPEMKPGTSSNVHELSSPHTLTSLPVSFTQRLVDCNTHDSAGNTCGARFEVPSEFLETHGVRLQRHVQLQGIRGDSPVRTMTCSEMEGENGGRSGLWLAWGDFVRENDLRAGQELAFLMTSDSSFCVREVSDIGDK